MIPRKKKICKSCGHERYIFAKGMCQPCQPKKKIKNGNKNARTNSDFYQSVILENKGRPCEECGCEIPFPSATNVSHIITRGANDALRSDRRNHRWYCHRCHHRYEYGDRLGMRTNEQNQNIKIILLNEYYNSKPWKGVRREVDTAGPDVVQGAVEIDGRERSGCDSEEEEKDAIQPSE